MHLADLKDLLAHQCGVVSRGQLLTAGARQHDVDRWVRRRELARVHPGVYVDHTGPLSPSQRAWAAVLYAEPAALHLTCALSAAVHGEVVDVAVDAGRRVTAQPGIRIHRVRGLEARVLWSASPPRVRVEEAVLELANRATTELEVVRILSDAIGSRRTTVERLREALRARARIRRREWIERLLGDLDSGACSVLEHRYLTHVERGHALPQGSRQAPRRLPSGMEYRDVEYQPFGVVVELDGRAAHASWDARGRDADRDLDDVAAGRVTVRLRYAQVFDRACRTAHRLARILQQRGRTHEASACGPDCAVRPS